MAKLPEDHYLTLCGANPSNTCSQSFNVYLHGDDEENGDCNDSEIEGSQDAKVWLAYSKCSINNCQVQMNWTLT